MITHTQHGVRMSPRMSRLWTYIREERKIDLFDFSTDECVERQQRALRAGERELVKRAAENPGDRDLARLLADYVAIADRRPHERTTSAMLRSEAAALRARGMAPDEIAEMIGEKAR